MEYKNSYFAEFTKEVTTIDIDYIPYRRGADADDVELNENFEPVTLIRASRYCQLKWSDAPNYDIYINGLAQHTLNELTLQSDEVLGRMVKRLEQLNQHIKDAWEILKEHRQLWDEGKFSAIDFEWKFFGNFNIPKTSNAGIVGNPNFEKGITTSDFFADLRDAIWYKQGAIEWALWHIKNQLGQEHSEQEINPKESDLPSVDKPVKATYNQYVYALICNYLKKEKEREEIANEFEFEIKNKQQQLINTYRHAHERTGIGKRTHNKRCDDFVEVIKLLSEKGYTEAARQAESEFLCYQNTYDAGEK